MASIKSSISLILLALSLGCGDSRSSKNEETSPDNGLPIPSQSLRAGVDQNGANLVEQGALYQAFHWYSPNDGLHWQRLEAQLPLLKSKGVTGLWIPPASKGKGGSYDVGYGVYDAYDLGEFQQKGSVRTRYGTRQQLLALVQEASKQDLALFGDVVLNHRLGADRTERVEAIEVDPQNRSRDLGSPKTIDAWTRFDFAARAGQYSRFTWNAKHFTGVDWDQSTQQTGKIYRFPKANGTWSQDVSRELGNYDFLLGADLDFSQPEVAEEIKNWGLWYSETLQLRGFRLDALKHVSTSYLRSWLDEVREKQTQKIFAIGEYWTYSVDELLAYLSQINQGQDRLALFDVPLHVNFFEAGRAQGRYTMSRLLDDTLMQRAPHLAISFVDNHDTQPLQALESPVANWFKPLAYAVILLRAESYPSIFAADYEGATYREQRNGQWRDIVMPSFATEIDLLLQVRRSFRFSLQRSYFDQPDLVGWTRSQEGEEPQALAVVLSDGEAGSKRMEVGLAFQGQCFVNLQEPAGECVKIDEKGWGEFPVSARNFALWASRKL